MSHELLVKFCSPTLAGIKVSNLVNVRFACEKKLRLEITKKNRMLNRKGLYVEILNIKRDTALVYVYRKSALKTLLQDSDNRMFLHKYGYSEFDINSALEVLKEHVKQNDFPHEIGVFLGYPLSDVIAFIENKGKNEEYVGCWKAYSNVSYAQKTHIKYKRCTELYCDKFAQGTDIEKLTVAC